VTTRASAVVTGAGSGIGRAIAHRLHHDGRAVVLVDVDAAALSRVAKELGAAVIAVDGDVANPQTHLNALAAAAELGQLDAWVNCAGLTRSCPLPELTSREAAVSIDVNLYGTLWGTQTAVAHWLEESTQGDIVNISSVHGRRAYPDHAIYEMTKAAIEALTRNVAVTYAAAGIRANAVAPGAVITPALTQSLASAPDPAAALAELTELIPAGRMAEADEIAGAVAFLLSPAASYITGQTLVMDGAMTAHIGFEPDPNAKRVK
jgi:NAD(P)-dependent dehydrogenase (short-subunit alcohol dehydrogenase family)